MRQCDLPKAGRLRIYVASPRRALNQNGGFANDPSCIDAQSQQWHVNLGRQLATHMKGSVAYVGSESDRLVWTVNANAAGIPFSAAELTGRDLPAGRQQLRTQGFRTGYGGLRIGLLQRRG